MNYIESMDNPRVFDFLNYRQYLKKYYRYRKERDSYFSYRYFAKSANLKTASLYPNIVTGKKNLTKSILPGFIKALSLKKTESEYFKLLIEFNHASSNKSRQILFDKMVPYLPEKTRRLREIHKNFYTQWYHVAIHQALNVIDVNKGNLHELRKFIIPNLDLKKVKDSIHTLKELKLIELKDGFLKPSQNDLVGGKEVGKVYIQKFQQEMMDVIKSTLNDHKPEDKYIITESFAVSHHCRLNIQEKTKKFHGEIIKMILSDTEKEDEVFQMNLQLFPISKNRGEN